MFVCLLHLVGVVRASFCLSSSFQLMWCVVWCGLLDCLSSMLGWGRVGRRGFVLSFFRLFAAWLWSGRSPLRSFVFYYLFFVYIYIYIYIFLGGGIPFDDWHSFAGMGDYETSVPFALPVKELEHSEIGENGCGMWRSLCSHPLSSTLYTVSPFLFVRLFDMFSPFSILLLLRLS